MNTGDSYSIGQVFIKIKRTDLKWYQKLWNIISGHKDRNWKWIPVKNMCDLGDV